MSVRRRALAWALRLGGLVAFPLLLWAGVDFGEAADILRDSDIPLLVAALVALQATLLLRVWRWRLLAESAGVRYPRFWDYALLFYTGLFAGVAVPQLAASFAPVIFMAEDGHPWQRSVASIIADRIVEGVVTVLFAFAAALYLFPLVPRLSLSIALACGLIMVLLGATYAWRRWLWAVLASRAGGMGWVRSGLGQLRELAEGLAAQRRALAPAAVLAVLSALLDAVVAIVAARSLGIEAFWLFIAVAWTVVALVVMLPISIGGLGPREGMLVLLFTVAGEGREEALALGLVLFVLTLISRLPGGAAWAIRPVRAERSAASR